MATFLLVRHGEPDYDAAGDIGFYGFGRSFAPLTERGVQQAEQAAHDPRLLAAECLVTSPYTRAMQTAAIISRHTGKPIVVEPELHEWIADWTNSLRSTAEATVLFQEFHRCRGVYPEGQTCRWETLAALQARIHRVADRYADRDCVALVGHGMAFRTLTRIEKLGFAEVLAIMYQRGQAPAEFVFK